MIRLKILLSRVVTVLKIKDPSQISTDFSPTQKFGRG